MRPFGFALVASGLSVLVAVAAGCEEPIPAHPTYDIEVKPLFEAHCVRCHGAGGTLNGDPRALNSYGTTPAAMACRAACAKADSACLALCPMADKPNLPYLNFYADEGDCTVDATGGTPASCKRGAKGQAATIKVYIHLPGAGRMPLAPAEPLTEWELGVVDNWINDGAPEAPP
jgi:hypothetical protein